MPVESIGNIAPSAVIEAIETSLVDSSTALGRSEDGIVFHGSDVTWVYTGVPTLSRVLGARFTTDDVQDRVSEILGYFKTLETPVSWVVGPSTYPPTLGDYLSASGFGIGDKWMGMAMNLARRPKMHLPRGLEIKQVSDDQGLTDWAKLWADGDGEDQHGAVNLFSPENAGGDSRACYYLGYYNGQPASRAMTFRRDNIVGVYWVAAKNEYRGHGFRSAMVRRAMDDAASAGASALVMAVPSDGLSFSEKLGFKPYCEFSVYNWPRLPNRSDVC
jgi:GNAT superfamily N-acetyltransferase